MQPEPVSFKNNPQAQIKSILGGLGEAAIFFAIIAFISCAVVFGELSHSGQRVTDF